MLHNKGFARTLMCAILIISVAGVLPAAAQDADWLVSNERGTVGISSPAAGDMLSGMAEIAGTATSPAFNYYKVEYSVDGEAWFPVDGDAYRHETAVTDGNLVTWDTTAFRDGSYWLRAVVVDNTGNYVASDPIRVMIDNPEAEEAVVEEEAEVVVETEEPEAEEITPEETAPTPSWLVSNERGTVGISSPEAGETLSGMAEISGTATSPAFNYYKVEYSVDGEAWFPVDGDAYRHEAPITDGNLVTWDTTTFADGSYWLRAVVVDNTGNYVASDPIRVTVNNLDVEG